VEESRQRCLLLWMQLQFEATDHCESATRLHELGLTVNDRMRTESEELLFYRAGSKGRSPVGQWYRQVARY